MPGNLAADDVYRFNRRAARYFRGLERGVHRRTDRLFVWLLGLEWLAAFSAALWIAPLAWAGSASRVHPNVWASLLLGGLAAWPPALLAVFRPGWLPTRHAVAVGQMVMGALFIHLTSGRLETHFHIFGSLAFLAFYRDWRVLATASVVVVLDHYFRGIYWPQSIYGVVQEDPWRWIEHAGWVVFEDLFLLHFCREGVREMRRAAKRRARLQAVNDSIDRQVQVRTAELRASEEQARTILTAALDCVITADSRGRVLEFNPAAERTFGYRRDQAVGRSFTDLVLPEVYRERYVEGIADFLRSGAGPLLNNRREMLACRADGAQFPVELIVVAATGGDGLPWFIVYLRDITDRKLVESELLRARAAAEAASQAKSDFLANVSHELRTPLNGILGMAGLLADTALDAEQHEYVTAVCSCGHELLGIVARVLDFADIDAGRLSFRSEPFSLRTTVLAAAARTAAAAAVKGLGWVCRIDPSIPDALVGDPSRLAQVLDCLLDNAFKFTEVGGLALRVEPASSGDQQVGVRFSVEDTGVGIAPEKREEILRPFEQADASATRRYGGVGIGLPLVVRLVERMSGRLTFVSRPGQGSTFSFDAFFAAGDLTPARVEQHFAGGQGNSSRLVSSASTSSGVL